MLLNKKLILAILILGIIGVLILPWLCSLPAFTPYLDFSKTGNVGATIGGLTSPVIGLVSIFLLFFTLYEQININKFQKDFNDKQIYFNQSQIHSSQLSAIFNLQNQLSFLAKNFSFSIILNSTHHNTQFKGINNLNQAENGKFVPSDFMQCFSLSEELLNTYILFLNLLFDSSLPNQEKKAIFNSEERIISPIVNFYKFLKDNELECCTNLQNKEIYSNQVYDSLKDIETISSKIYNLKSENIIKKAIRNK